MNVERVAIDSVRLDAGNVRKHGKRNLETIQRSLKEFGQQKPIVVGADGVVVAGNGTLDAARALGWTHIDVVRTGLEGSARKAYAVADNRTAELAEWDDTGLAEYLAGLKADETFDETVTGFDAGEIERLIGRSEVVEDETPAVPETPITRPGDLWLLGDHKVLCGDATKGEDVDVVNAGENADAVLTDPPYGTNQPGVPGDAPEDHVRVVGQSVSLLPVINAAIVAFQSPRTFPVWLDAVRASGHQFERMLTLYKEAQCTYPWRGWILKSESILISSVGEPRWQDVKPYHHDVYSVVEVSGEIDAAIGWHGSIKPIKVVLDILQRICAPGDLVYDPFLGSGTTLIAAEQLGRKCFGIEIEGKYCDVAVKRWEQLTGKNATLESSGKTFAELAVDKS